MSLAHAVSLSSTNRKTHLGHMWNLPKITTHLRVDRFTLSFDIIVFTSAVYRPRRVWHMASHGRIRHEMDSMQGSLQRACHSHTFTCSISEQCKKIKRNTLLGHVCRSTKKRTSSRQMWCWFSLSPRKNKHNLFWLKNKCCESNHHAKKDNTAHFWRSLSHSFVTRQYLTRRSRY